MNTTYEILKSILWTLNDYLFYVYDTQNTTFFSSKEEYLAHETGTLKKRTTSRLQIEYDLSDLEFKDIKEQIKKSIALTKELIIRFDLEKYNNFKVLIQTFYNFNFKFPIRNEEQDYLYGMRNSITRINALLDDLDQILLNSSESNKPQD